MKHRPSAYRFQWYVKSTRRSATVAILLAVFISLSSDTCGAQQAPPKLVLHRTVTFADRQTYIELPFEVPEGHSCNYPVELHRARQKHHYRLLTQPAQA